MRQQRSTQTTHRRKSSTRKTLPFASGCQTLPQPNEVGGASFSARTESLEIRRDRLAVNLRCGNPCRFLLCPVISQLVLTSTTDTHLRIASMLLAIKNLIVLARATP